MRFHPSFAAIAILLLAVSVSRAEDKPNTLTPKEAAEGWLLLFDGETPFGWGPTPGTSTKAGWPIEPAVKNGALIFTGVEKGGEILNAYSTLGLGEYELTCEARRSGPSKASLGFAVSDKGVTTMWYDADELCPAVGEWKKIAIKGQTFDGVGHQVTLDKKRPFGVGPERDGSKTFTSRLAVEVRPRGKIELRNLKLKPGGMKPLFNGNDLTGWKVFEGKEYKSVYTVTPAGELNVKNGKGDLQTTAKYDNFCLQLECKTLGKALNSGVFFRCIADQYQNGYECQIHNGFKDDDRTKPADGGTGAIYRRVPARKVVANDHEWFTMTLLAAGPRMRTWVNGWPTADWVDERKPHENPRTGLRLEAGHLSIQGHDPTTDILFRNLKLAELPK